MTRSVAPMTVLMLLIFAVMVGVAMGYPAAARFMPFTVGIPALALCVIQLVLDWYRGRAPAADADGAALKQAQEQVALAAGRRIPFDMPSENAMFTDASQGGRETLRREFVAWAYFLALIACILLFGFRATVPIFLIAFLRFQAGATWRSALIFGGAGALVMYVLFEKVLRVTLHAGFVTDFIFARLAA